MSFSILSEFLLASLTVNIFCSNYVTETTRYSFKSDWPIERNQLIKSRDMRISSPRTPFSRDLTIPHSDFAHLTLWIIVGSSQLWPKKQMKKAIVFCMNFPDTIGQRRQGSAWWGAICRWKCKNSLTKWRLTWKVHTNYLFFVSYEDIEFYRLSI